MEQCVDEASIIIRNTKEPTLTLKVILTSPLIRDELEKKDGGTHVYIYLFCSCKTSLECYVKCALWISEVTIFICFIPLLVF